MRIIRGVLLVLVLLAVILAIALGLFIRRGFRATAVASPFETRVARTVRNYSIPRAERQRPNPYKSSDDAAQKGREVFLNRCAPCHGVDGSGKTQLGTNLYPTVPDLRASATQTLSDGEIHYIIENGVQLTGMPAWQGPHHPSPETWNIVSFIRTLPRPDSSTRESSQSLGSAHYVGSQACEKCHSDIYRRWQKTPMANIVRDLRSHPDAIIPDLSTNHVARFSKDQVAFVYGSIWKQRYFTKINDDYFPLPVQWDVATRTWLPYKVPDKGGDWWAKFYPPDNMQRPTGPTCDGCHSVNYNVETKQPSEWNVGCERCHGPGSEHVAHPSTANILNPASMDSVASNDVCVQCHSQGQPLTNPIKGKYFDWPVGYNPGLHLRDYWKLEDCTYGQTTFYYFPDCTAHKNRMQGNDFAQSVMYRRGITCADCHDVHGTANYAQLRKPATEICLDCHGPTSPNGPHTDTIEEHTHHKASSEGSQCVACHMPAIETEGVPGAMVHAHTFRFVSPAMTDKYNMPNPCTSCHKDKSNDWAKTELNHWTGISPWRAEF